MAFIGLFSELLLKYSAYLNSKKTGTNISPIKTFLSCYKSACEEDPELKSFDSSLHQRTSKLMSSLTGRGGKTGNLSLDSLIDVCEFLVELSQDVVKIITDNTKDMSNIQELKPLVDLYYESTNKTLSLFNTVENCVKKAERNQLFIRIAIKQFETESMDMDLVGNKKKKYEETLKELNKLKDIEDPFGDEFWTQYEAVYKEQIRVFETYRELQVKLDKKEKNVKKWRRFGNIVLATSVLSVIALSMYLLTVASPMVVATVAIGLTKPIVVAGTWVNDMWKEHEKVFKTQKDTSLLIENRTKLNVEAMKTIKNLVETLEIRISSILKTVEVGVEKREEEAMKLVMQEINKKVEGFAEKIEEIGDNAAKCSKSIISGRVRVMEHIANSKI